MEYLVRCIDGEWFNLHCNDFGNVLCPKTFSSKVIEGWGDHRIEINGCEVAFSYEDPGIQIIFESDEISEDIATKIVNEIYQNIVNHTGQKGKVIFLG